MKRSLLGLIGLFSLLNGCSSDPDNSLGSGLGPGTAPVDGTQGDAPAGGDPGGGVGGGPGGGEDGGACEKVILKADRATPDMLIVLDRSGSMIQNQSNTDRWRGSVGAINTVLQELESDIRFGLMTFPGGGLPPECANVPDVQQCLIAAATCGLPIGGCNASAECQACSDALGGLAGLGGNACAPGELNVPMSIMNAGPIASALGRMSANGATPTAQSLQQAREVLASVEPEMGGGPEGFLLSKYVMLVTDGDPNCSSENSTGGQGEDTTAQMATIEEVENLAGDGVKTYVIGFQTAGSDFAGVLDQMAVAGQTGDQAHRSVNSGDQLLEEFRKIAGSAVSCSFVLGQEVDESRVEIRVDGELTDYGTDWDIREDGRTIDLLGGACDALQTGGIVEAEVFCEVVRVI